MINKDFWRTKNNMKRRQRGLAGGAIKREQTGESFWMMLLLICRQNFYRFFPPHIYSAVWILQVSFVQMKDSDEEGRWETSTGHVQLSDLKMDKSLLD